MEMKKKRIISLMIALVMLTAMSTFVTVSFAATTIGYTSVGSTDNLSGANDINAFRFQASSAMTVTTMKVYLASNVSGKMKLAIYSDNNGSPGTLLKSTNEITNPAAGWVTFTLTASQALTTSSYYWLCEWANATYTTRCETTGGTAKYKTVTYSGTWPAGSTINMGPVSNKDSIYAEASGGATPTPTATPTATATPTPTATSTPTPTSTPGGWPTESNTGVPAGTVLTNSGEVIVTTDGAVIDALNITGAVTVYANNVTIKRCRITAAGDWGIKFGVGNYTGLTIQDCEITGNGSTYLGAGVFDVTDAGAIQVLRCKIQHCSAGVNLGDHDTVQDCWITPQLWPGEHSTCIGGGNGTNILFRHNTCNMPEASSGAIANYTDFANIDGMTIDNNWIDGGSYGLTVMITNHPNAKNIHVTNNVFARTYNRTCGLYGPVAWSTFSSQTGNTWVNNTWGGNPWQAGDPAAGSQIAHP